MVYRQHIDSKAHYENKTKLWRPNENWRKLSCSVNRVKSYQEKRERLGTAAPTFIHNHELCFNSNKNILPEPQTTHTSEFRKLACAMATVSFGFRFPPRSSYARVSHTSSLQVPLLNKFNSLKLSSSSSISGSFIPQRLCTVASPLLQRLQPLTIVSAKGYKMKTHKVPSTSLSVPLLFCVIGVPAIYVLGV